MKLHENMKQSFYVRKYFSLSIKFLVYTLISLISKFEAIFEFYSFLFSGKFWWLGLLLENDDEKIFPVHGFFFYFMCITVQGSQTSFYKTNLAWTNRDTDSINIYISNFFIGSISFFYLYIYWQFLCKWYKFVYLVICHHHGNVIFPSFHYTA